GQTGVAEGIDWNKERQFWSFRPPMAQARPTVKAKRWPSQPLDYFVLARLERANLSPTQEADPRTLIRRVTFDLTGLPPTPEEVEAFVRDYSSSSSSSSSASGSLRLRTLSGTKATVSSDGFRGRGRGRGRAEPDAYGKLVDRL